MVGGGQAVTGCRQDSRWINRKLMSSICNSLYFLLEEQARSFSESDEDQNRLKHLEGNEDGLE